MTKKFFFQSFTRIRHQESVPVLGKSAPLRFLSLQSSVHKQLLSEEDRGERESSYYSSPVPCCSGHSEYTQSKQLYLHICARSCCLLPLCMHECMYACGCVEVVFKELHLHHGDRSHFSGGSLSVYMLVQTHTLFSRFLLASLCCQESSTKTHPLCMTHI